jgi:hypothetical protein
MTAKAAVLATPSAHPTPAQGDDNKGEKGEDAADQTHTGLGVGEAVTPEAYQQQVWGCDVM